MMHVCVLPPLALALPLSLLIRYHFQLARARYHIEVGCAPLIVVAFGFTEV